MHYSKKAEHIYAIISKLNNELANCNRELEQKNYELNCVNKKFSQMLNTDYLTGLFSRKFIQDKLNYFITTIDPTIYDTCIMFGDIDYFKKVNDTYGHTSGDQVLITVSKTIKESIPKNSFAGRLGGEEFLIILEDLNTEQAKIIENKIRLSLTNIQISNHFQDITLSWGITTIKKGDTVDSILTRSDNAMYNSKKSGKNQSTIC